MSEEIKMPFVQALALLRLGTLENFSEDKRLNFLSCSLKLLEDCDIDYRSHFQFSALAPTSHKLSPGNAASYLHELFNENSENSYSSSTKKSQKSSPTTQIASFFKSKLPRSRSSKSSPSSSPVAPSDAERKLNFPSSK
jgi:hypothetical protein